MGDTYFLLLSCLGFVITAQAQDCPKPTVGPNMFLKDEHNQQETFPDGSTATFECVVGYLAAGPAVITCTAGTWSPLRLTCRKKNCGPAGQVPNGHFDYSEGTEFGDKVVISCDPGYGLVGNNQLFCGDKGWKGRLPVCEVVTCDPPASIDGGSFTPRQESYDYREVVRYSCLMNDYTLDGPKSLICSENGMFEPDPPKCTMVQCEDPVIENAVWIEGSRPPHRFKAMVKYQCISGYVMEGPSTLICGINSQWSSKYPTCQKVVVPTKPPTPTTTTTTTTKRPKDVQCKEPVIKHAIKVGGSPPYTYKSTVTYECSSGYEMKGKETLTCGIDGNWSSDLPHCKGKANIALPVGLTVAAVAIAACAMCGCYYYGLPPFNKKKRGAGKSYPDSEATKDEEGVALS
ncbi:membrane cofactor protein-like isoform X2 [Pempheris klunzingeri]